MFFFTEWFQSDSDHKSVIFENIIYSDIHINCLFVLFDYLINDNLYMIKELFYIVHILYTQYGFYIIRSNQIKFTNLSLFAGV
jgi:hypothetical protein